jgi:hypothetical protein
MEACDLAERAACTPETNSEALDVIIVRAREIRSLADQPEPPGVMTVGMALMLPEVRSGAMLVRFMYQGVDPVALRAIAGEPHIEWSDGDYDNGWEEWAPEPDELLLPCTLISSQGGAR